MSEQEEIKLFSKIEDGIRLAHRRMLERKAKLGESVVYADANGMPYTITAVEALRRLNSHSCLSRP